MLQQEFKEMTGLTPTNEEFNDIHQMYMYTDLDKYDFCIDYKKHGKSQILQQLYHQHEILTNDMNMVQKRIHEQCNNLLQIAQTAENPEEIYKIVRQLAGNRYVISYKIENDIQLTSSEKSFILNEIK